MSVALIGTERQGLPQVTTSLIGRDELVERVVDAILSEGSRLVTLLGPGGIGKTRMALAVAEACTFEFSDGVSFVSLAALTSAELVTSTIASALGVSGANDDPLEQQIVDRLHGQTTLLIVDNFEHVLDAAPLISWLLANVLGLSVLATSRSALRLGGERILDVPPLALPEAAEGSDALSSPAVQLFLERAPDHALNGALADDSIERIATICRQLDGLPLAIELAATGGSATRATSWSPADGILLPDLDQADYRQQTMSSTVAWSYNLLAPDEQKLLRRLSAFTGGFSIDAIATIYSVLNGQPTDYLIDPIVSLIDQSLVLPLFDANGVDRGSMLQTIAEFGRHELRNSNEDVAFFTAHAQLFLEFSMRAEPGLRGTEQLQWVQLIDADLGNIRSAIEWYRSRGDLESALQLTVALGWYWSSPGHFHEGRDLYDRLLATHSDGVSAETRIRVLVSAADIDDWLMNLPKAQERYEEAAELCRTTGDVATLTAVDRGLGSIALGKGEFERAATHFSAAIESSIAANDAWNHAACTNLLGVVRFAQGDYDEAIALCTRATEEWRLQGDPGHVVAGVASTGVVALAASRFALARELGEFALIEADRLDDEWFRARSAIMAGALLIEAGRHAEGVRLMAFGEGSSLAIGTPVFKATTELYERFKDRARRALSEKEYAEYVAAGAVLPGEVAVKEAASAFASLQEYWSIEQPRSPELSRRELEVLGLLAQGKTDREIADELFIERRTVSKHVAAILEKLDVPNRSAAASMALRLGLI